MSGSKVILDSNIIIFASKKQLDIQKLLNPYEDFYVSIITLMEVYGYDFSNLKEKKLIDEIFSNLKIVDVNVAIAEQVIQYRKNKIKKIKLPDAIILSTAKYLNSVLISDDWDDFIGFDNKVLIKNIDEFKVF